MLENSEIFLFQNIRQVIKAEQWCMKSKMEVRVIPVPKPYSTECGLCLEISTANSEKLVDFVRESGMEIRIINSQNKDSQD